MENLEFTYVNDIGEIKISDLPLAICAVNATLRIEGVIKLAGGIKKNGIDSDMGKEKISKAVKVDQEKDGIVFQINATVKYGAKIPVVAWNIQEAVKKEVEEITGKKVKAVNVEIQSVELEY